MHLQTVIKKDGSFDLCYEQKVLLEDCIPYIDERPLHAISCESTGTNIRYTTLYGEVQLLFAVEGEILSITTQLTNYTRKIRTFSVLGTAGCGQMTGLFQAPEGMAGDGGYLPLEELPAKGLSSAGLLSLRFQEQYLTLYFTDHTHYRNMFRIGNDRYGITVSPRVYLENQNSQNVTLPVLKLFLSNGLASSLQAAAKDVASYMGARNDKPEAFHWCSWYYCYHNFDHGQLNEYLQGFQDTNMIDDLQYVQIDAGYSPALGDWLLPNGRWPSGLKGAFESIIAAGKVPGIWVGIYMVGNRSQLYQQHPDWILYDLAGKPISPWISHNEPKHWDYQDEEYYVLDTSHPQAMDYVRTVFRTLKSWGAGLFKTDFMFWGYQDSSKVRRHTPGKTSVEYLRDAMQVIREEIGEESYWLGCIAPFYPFIGYVDGMRVGGDVGSQWKGNFNPQNMIDSVLANNYSNHIYYQNDPDSILLRNFFLSLTDTEIESIALLAGLSGGCVYTSDPLHKLPEDRLNLFKYLKPNGKHTPILPFLDQNRRDIVLTYRSEDKAILFVFNRTDNEILEEYNFRELGLHHTYYARDYKNKVQYTEQMPALLLRTPAHGSNLFFLSKTPEEADMVNIWNNL